MEITIFPSADLSKYSKNEASDKAKYGELLKIKSKNEFYEAIMAYAWSPSIFKESIRNMDNFIKCSFIAFDIDDNIDLKNAIERVKLTGYTCVIGTTLSHKKDKDGIVADRYRLIFPLQKPITNVKDFKATWLSLAGEENTILYGADQSCKDASRFFFPCENIALIEGHRKVEVVKHIEKFMPKKKVNKNGKGKLSKRTKKFLEEGAGSGQRHHEFVLAVLDMKAQGYTKQEVKHIMIPLMQRVKPEEKAEFQINYLFDKYNVEFEYRRRGR